MDISEEPRIENGIMSAKRVVFIASTRAPWMEREACEVTEETVARAWATANVAVAISQSCQLTFSRIVRGGGRGREKYLSPH